MDDQDEKALLEHVTDKNIEIVQSIIDPEPVLVQKKRRYTSIVVAVMLWVATLILASHSSIPSEQMNGRSAQGELLGLSLMGLLLVVFANDYIANLTGLRLFVSWIQIDKPTPLFLLRFLGWVLLIAMAFAFLVS